MQNFLSLFIKELWQKSGKPNSLIFYKRFIFFVFCLLEYFYRFIFFVVQAIKKKLGNKTISESCVISVGNLTVGGTGKTVFISFLAKKLGLQNTAIVSRGYGAKSAGKNNKNLLVCDGAKIFYSPKDCGDEPFMLAKTLSTIVVTGSNRYKSCAIIGKLSRAIKYILLDDAYQNLQVKKDFEILLIDARFPLGVNGHCLPAGDLREFDYSRADVIILTHADLVGFDQILEIKNKILNNFDSSKIYSGTHKNIGLFQADLNIIEPKLLADKKFMLVAGIGSISGFINSVESFGIKVGKILEFPDHYFYSRADINKILDTFKSLEFSGIIVTQKDWVKLSFILDDQELKLFFVFRIEFEFLHQAEYISFIKALESKLTLITR